MAITNAERTKAERVGSEIYDRLLRRETSFRVAALALAQAVLLVAKAAAGKQKKSDFHYLELWERTAQQWWYGEPQ